MPTSAAMAREMRPVHRATPAAPGRLGSVPLPPLKGVGRVRRSKPLRKSKYSLRALTLTWADREPRKARTRFSTRGKGATSTPRTVTAARWRTSRTTFRRTAPVKTRWPSRFGKLRWRRRIRRSGKRSGTSTVVTWESRKSRVP